MKITLAILSLVAFAFAEEAAQANQDSTQQRGPYV
jgi:hypothetical protein